MLLRLPSSSKGPKSLLFIALHWTDREKCWKCQFSCTRTQVERPQVTAQYQERWLDNWILLACWKLSHLNWQRLSFLVIVVLSRAENASHSSRPSNAIFIFLTIDNFLHRPIPHPLIYGLSHSRIKFIIQSWSVSSVLTTVQMHRQLYTTVVPPWWYVCK